MNFPKSILVIKYFPSYKNSEVPDYIPICVTSVENAKIFSGRRNMSFLKLNKMGTWDFLKNGVLNKMKIHVGFVKEGTIFHFPNSVYDYMKVCDRNGIGGVVNLSTGLYISTSNLEKEGLSPMIDCKIEENLCDDWIV